MTSDPRLIPFVLLLAAGCGARTPAVVAPPSNPAPASPPASAGGTEAGASTTAPDQPADELARELEALFATPTLATGVVSALVQSLDSGQVLFRYHPDTLVVPGSNMKIVTMAAAAQRLGWDFRYETRLESVTEPRDGVLAGDLFVVGTGDPTINARNGDRLSTFRQWASDLKRAGVSRVTGRLVGDDDAFDDERFGDGWSWDDFVHAYAAPVGPLQFNENAVELGVTPANDESAPASVSLGPASEMSLAEPQVITGPAGSEPSIRISRSPGGKQIVVSGSVPKGGRETIVRAAVDNPTTFFLRSLRDLLIAEGIRVEGDIADIDDAFDRASLKTSSGRRHVLVRHHSPTLAEIGRTMMKASQNLYAETVFRTLSLAPGPASIPASRELEGEALRSWGIAPGAYSIADGSGLSRLNFVSASTVIRVLRTVALNATLASRFEEALPIAGRDGTLSGRMRATRAEGNAAAKTGTLSSVRSLAGYVRTRDGERLAFAFLVNNFLIPASAVDATVDQAVERLANFAR